MKEEENEVGFFSQASGIPGEDLEKLHTGLLEELGRMNEAGEHGYEDDRASLHLPEDKEAFRTIKALINEKRTLKPAYLVVVGIGGSNLGTVAVQEAVLGRLYNQQDPPTKIVYADTVDADLLAAITAIIEPVLKRGGNILINGVSKSGGTTETIANFEVLLAVLQKYKPEWKQYVVVTTDKNSKYWSLAQQQGFSLLEIPSKVGGRYSVFSAVGLFPLGMIGIDIDALMRGAQAMKKRCLSPRISSNPAALGAALSYAQYKRGKNIHDLFLFSTDLESLGKWFRQLLAESIGKEYDRNGNQVLTGITPTVSIGSTDLHSMAQLALGGPFDKFTTFVRVIHTKAAVRIPTLPEYAPLVSGIQGRSLDEILQAILRGVQAAYRNGNRPFVEVVLPDKTAYSIGQFMQLQMMETMFLGALCEINPFDQPNVEAYKRETRAILEKHRDPEKA
jgi:glucose-6-phosphate isomerase